MLLWLGLGLGAGITVRITTSVNDEALTSMRNIGTTFKVYKGITLRG